MIKSREAVNVNSMEYYTSAVKDKLTKLNAYTEKCVNRDTLQRQTVVINKTVRYSNMHNLKYMIDIL